VREQLVVWNPGAAPITVDAATLYKEVRKAVTRNEHRLNIEGVVACAEDSDSALTDGAVLGARVGLLDEHGARLVVDVDRSAVPAQIGRLVWDWR